MPVELMGKMPMLRFSYTFYGDTLAKIMPSDFADSNDRPASERTHPPRPHAAATLTGGLCGFAGRKARGQRHETTRARIFQARVRMGWLVQ